MIRSYFKTALAFLLFFNLMLGSNSAITIHTIGDSTMADQDENTTEKRGWGQMFHQFFTNGMVVNNRAKSGASSKSFYLESPYWATVKKQIKSGEYVMVQFGHNDEKNGGLDGDTLKLTDPTVDYRGTTANGTYRKYIRAYVNEIRQLGGIPILVTPICRKYFSSGKITRRGQHDLGEYFNAPADDHTYDYSFVTREVAVELNVEMIDLTEITRVLYESYGEAACSAQLFTSDDGTHPSAQGASLIARLCAQELVGRGILTDYISTQATMSVNPPSHDFGVAFVSQTRTKEFAVSAFDLEPANGSVTVSVTNGFLLAANRNDTPTSTINLAYTGSNLQFASFHVVASPQTSGPLEGTLTVSGGNQTKNIALKALFTALTDGAPLKVVWPLAEDKTPEVLGMTKLLNQAQVNLYTQSFAALNANAVWPASSGYDANHKVQLNQIKGDTWPAGEIDEVSNRYIAFGISPAINTEITVDSIGLYLGSAGGNGMRCRVSYSTNMFADYTVVQEFSSMDANTVYAVSASPSVKLAYGEKLIVRIYPWYSEGATGKTIGLSDVCIRGLTHYVQKETAAQGQSAQLLIVSTDQSNLNIAHAPLNSCLNLYTITGAKLHTSTHNQSSITVAKPTQSGVYMYELRSAQGVQTGKFVVQ